MTGSEAIRVAWRDAIWTNADVLALTDKIIEHDLSEETHVELSSIRFNQEINFFAFRVRRAIEPLMGEKNRLLFLVDISYTMQADPSGVNYNLVLDGIELIQDLVFSELGSRWTNTVGGSAPQAGPPNISVSTIGDEKVFKADYQYTGFICVDI